MENDKSEDNKSKENMKQRQEKSLQISTTACYMV